MSSMYDSKCCANCQHSYCQKDYSTPMVTRPVFCKFTDEKKHDGQDGDVKYCERFEWIRGLDFNIEEGQ